MTIRELIDELEDLRDEHGDDVDVRLAFQPSWPFEYSIGDVVAVGPTDVDDDDAEDEDGDEPVVVYIGERSQLGYLSGAAARALGWGRER